ncbi:hypothetical protein L249_1306 [Ophiocordyceps polyrhachis-furcata BCC 54312]|uniref:Uncharacterized protein n=1 Tax=Ophiocordyceps polyrhachis-furcata BCC 54312 TaxID=1330021 RepID=A0A367LDN1_9HYPO|nr:hypothetical protein L249_1306 [Ophiocordyceps polyrhachis-furcata BCC 54312]
MFFCYILYFVLPCSVIITYTYDTTDREYEIYQNRCESTDDKLCCHHLRGRSRREPRRLRVVIQCKQACVEQLANIHGLNQGLLGTADFNGSRISVRLRLQQKDNFPTQTTGDTLSNSTKHPSVYEDDVYAGWHRPVKVRDVRILSVYRCHPQA